MAIPLSGRLDHRVHAILVRHQDQGRRSTNEHHPRQGNQQKDRKADHSPHRAEAGLTEHKRLMVQAAASAWMRHLPSPGDMGTSGRRTSLRCMPKADMSRSRAPRCAHRGCGWCGDAGTPRRARERAWAKSDRIIVPKGEGEKDTSGKYHRDPHCKIGKRHRT